MKRRATNPGNGYSKRLTVDQVVELVFNDSDNNQLDFDHYCQSDIEMKSNDQL